MATCCRPSVRRWRIDTMKAGNFVMLRADSLRLLLPQQEVGAAEYIEQAPRALPERGWFEYGSGEGARPVIALSAQMPPIASCSPGSAWTAATCSSPGTRYVF